MSVELEPKSHEPYLVSIDQIAHDSEIHSLVSDISTIRFGQPINYDLGDVSGMKSAMQKVFNFRVPGGERTEREDLPAREVFEDRILAVAQKIGLAGNTLPSEPVADAVVILGGAGKSVIDRTRYAKELIDNEKLQTNTVVFLGSSRPVGQAERDRGGPYATNATDEYALMQRAAEEVFGVTFDISEEFQGYDDKVPSGFEGGWKISYAKSADGKDIFVLSAPMLKENRFHSDDKRRSRANTSDTYDMLARVAQLAKGCRVVPVTNAHFKPFQGADAVTELSKYGIGAEVVGFDPAHFGNPPKEPEELLQEILSAVNSIARAKTELAKQIGIVAGKL